MNYFRIFAAVLVMAAITYLIRALPLIIFRKKIQNRFLQSFLYYIPYAVLAAMIVPEILYSTACILSASAGLAAALLLSYKKKGLLIVALGSTVIVYFTELLLTYTGLISF